MSQGSTGDQIIESMLSHCKDSASGINKKLCKKEDHTESNIFGQSNQIGEVAIFWNGEYGRKDHVLVEDEYQGSDFRHIIFFLRNL